MALNLQCWYDSPDGATRAVKDDSDPYTQVSALENSSSEHYDQLGCLHVTKDDNRGWTELNSLFSKIRNIQMKSIHSIDTSVVS